MDQMPEIIKKRCENAVSSRRANFEGNHFESTNTDLGIPSRTNLRGSYYQTLCKHQDEPSTELVEYMDQLPDIVKKYCSNVVSSRIANFSADPADSTTNGDPGKLTFRGANYQHLGKHQDDPNYGCPLPGSKTEFRGKMAFIHVSLEIVELCNNIQHLGTDRGDGTYVIHFGKLFAFYSRLSEKLVGVLVRARRQGLIDFEGEMLYQRQDELVPIRLIQMPVKLMERIEQAKEELKVHPSRNFHDTL